MSKVCFYCHSHVPNGTVNCPNCASNKWVKGGMVESAPLGPTGGGYQYAAFSTGATGGYIVATGGGGGCSGSSWGGPR